MALTKISTGGVKDDAASQAKIADEAVDEARLQVSNAGTNGQFLQKQSGNTGGLTWAAANQYTHPNHSGEVTSSADGAQTIASNVVDEDNLKISNAGTNGQYLQKQSGNTGGLTWADVTIPPSGNTFTAVANGSIANNKAVRVDTDGKVSEIKTTFAASNLSKQNGVEFNSGTDTRHSVTLYDPDANRVVTYWGNGTYPYMNATTWAISSSGVVSESNVATSQVENSVQIHNDHSGDHDFDVVYDTNLNKHLYLMTSHDDGNLYSKYGTYNSSNYGITFSHGTSNLTQIGSFAGSNPDVHYDSTTDRYVCVYRRTNNGYPYYVVGNQSGGTISWGTPTIIESVTIENGNNVNICSIGNGKVCIVWKYQSGNTVKAALGEISTSSNTLSNLYSATTVMTSNNGHHRLCYNEEDDNVIFAYTEASDYGYVRRISRNSNNNGLDISSQSSAIANDALDAGHLALVYAPVTKTVHIMIREGSDMYRSRVTNTSGTPTLQSTGSVNSHDIKFIGEPCAGPASLEGNERMYVGLYNETRNNRGDMWELKGITSASTLDSAQYYVGFADQAYTNGQTATIKTYGSVVDTLSGLTVGYDYYVKKDGSVGTSTDFTGGFSAGTPYAGKAVSSSKLIVQHPSIMQGL